MYHHRRCEPEAAAVGKRSVNYETDSPKRSRATPSRCEGETGPCLCRSHRPWPYASHENIRPSRRHSLPVSQLPRSFTKQKRCELRRLCSRQLCGPQCSIVVFICSSGETHPISIASEEAAANWSFQGCPHLSDPEGACF